MLKHDLYKEDIKKVAESNFLDFEFLRDKTILITGAAGLIGVFLVDVLLYRNKFYEDNIQIYALDRDKNILQNQFGEQPDEKLKFLVQDVCSEVIGKEDINYIVHLASNTHPLLYASDPVGTIMTNVMGLNNLLLCSLKQRNFKRFLMVSSVEIYGENVGDVDKFDEHYLGYIDCNTLRAGYQESKRLGESLCQAYSSQYHVDSVVARLSRVYGPTVKKDDSKALSQFINNAVNEQNIVLKSSGEQLFSYCYVADAVSGLLKVLIDGDTGAAYNIADDASNIKLKDLAKTLASLNQKNVVFENPSDKEKSGYSTATKAIQDSTKIHNLGWVANYDINQGVKRTVKILREIK